MSRNSVRFYEVQNKATNESNEYYVRLEDARRAAQQMAQKTNGQVEIWKCTCAVDRNTVLGLANGRHTQPDWEWMDREQAEMVKPSLRRPVAVEVAA